MKMNPNAPAYPVNTTREGLGFKPAPGLTIRLHLMANIQIGRITATEATALLGHECPTGPGKDLDRVRYLAAAEAAYRAVLADAIIAEHNKGLD